MSIGASKIWSPTSYCPHCSWGSGITKGKNTHSVILASGWSVEEMAVHQSTTVLIWLAATAIISGCRTPGSQRVNAEGHAYAVIAQKQGQILGGKSALSIERPSDILRRQLIERLSLPVAGPASLGTDQLSPVAHWPEPSYPKAPASRGEVSLTSGEPLPGPWPPTLI